MNLRYLGHSAVQLVGDAVELVIDPFVSGQAEPVVSLEELAPDLIVLSHAHGDHWGDTEELARANDATVVSSAEIAGHAGALGLASHAMNTGGARDFGGCKIKFTPAFHSSSFPDGSYGGMPMGVVIEIDGLRCYHAGDTALFSDMRLIGRGGLDVALLPIGDNFTMGPEDALEAVELLQPKLVVPIHYNTFPVIEQDGEAFARQVRERTSADCRPLRPGEGLSL